MPSSMDPTEAASALDIAATQRRALADETRRPRWMWAALFVYIVGLFTLEDFAPAAARWVILVIAVILLLRRVLPGVSLRVAALFGRRAQPGRNLLPLSTRIIMLVVIVGVWVGMYLLLDADLPRRLGAPTWMSDHSLAVTGVLIAIIITPFSWAVDSFVHGRAARHQPVPAKGRR
jgi:hypothetical protein